MKRKVDYENENYGGLRIDPDTSYDDDVLKPLNLMLILAGAE